MSETEYSLGRNCGMTFAGIKAASMVSIRSAEYEVFEKVTSCFEKKGFRRFFLRENGDRAVVLIYREESLAKILFESEISAFLAGYGYRYRSVEGALATLRSRMTKNEFPHEIGVFLGYPLADVMGFIENPHGGFKLCGYWKVYENEGKAAETFARFRRCSKCILKRMDRGERLEEIFRVA